MYGQVNIGLEHVLQSVILPCTRMSLCTDLLRTEMAGIAHDRLSTDVDDVDAENSRHVFILRSVARYNRLLALARILECQVSIGDPPRTLMRGAPYLIRACLSFHLSKPNKPENA